MPEIQISEEFHEFLNKKKINPQETIEEALKRMFHIHSFKPTKTKKIIFLGEANVGKSTIRKVLFDNIKPDLLLKKPLEPTKGLEFFNYDLFEANCSIIDTSGQELHSWLNDEADNVFPEADYVIYVVEAPTFQLHQTDVYDLLRKILILSKTYSKNVTVTIFVHKLDLIKDTEIKDFQAMVLREHRVFEIAEEIDIPLYFTSIVDPYLQWLNIALMKLLTIESLILPNYEQYLNDFFYKKSGRL